MERNQLQIGPTQIVCGSIFSVFAMVATLYAGAEVAGLGSVGFERMLLGALAALGVSLVTGAVCATAEGGTRVLLGLASQGANIWVLKAILATSWASATVVWVISMAISVVATVILAAVLAGIVAAVRSQQEAALWQRDPLRGLGGWDREPADFGGLAETDRLRRLLGN